MACTVVRGLIPSIQFMDMLYIHFWKKCYIAILIKYFFAQNLFSSDHTSPITHEKCFKHLQSLITCLYLFLKLVSLFSSKPSNLAKSQKLLLLMVQSSQTLLFIHTQTLDHKHTNAQALKEPRTQNHIPYLHFHINLPKS